MGAELNKQITKLKSQARFAGIKLNLDVSKDVVMIYPKHREDVAASMGHLLAENKIEIIAYVIDLKRLNWARMEGFSETQLHTENKDLNIFKEVRPDALINHLV